MAGKNIVEQHTHQHFGMATPILWADVCEYIIEWCYLICASYAVYAKRAGFLSCEYPDPLRIALAVILRTVQLVACEVFPQYFRCTKDKADNPCVPIALENKYPMYMQKLRTSSLFGEIHRILQYWAGGECCKRRGRAKTGLRLLHALCKRASCRRCYANF